MQGKGVRNSAKMAYFCIFFVLWKSYMSPIWVKCLYLMRFCEDALNSSIAVDYGDRNRVKTAKNGQNCQKWRKIRYLAYFASSYSGGKNFSGLNVWWYLLEISSGPKYIPARKIVSHAQSTLNKIWISLTQGWKFLTWNLDHSFRILIDLTI